MENKRINYNELQIAKEILPMLKVRVKKFKNRFSNQKINYTKKVLIINTCIIGDFLSTLPALSIFIKKNKLKADMVVSPNLKSLAEKVRGIDKVFTAKSSYNRETEKKEK